ncbi:MAG: hypothetical protein JXR77_19170 [Lentisphaeria bacterium]|nr:hypothetical protein [Lentisphaeria bacterium]
MIRRRKRGGTGSSLLALLTALAPLAGASAVCALMYYGLRVRPFIPRTEEIHDQTQCVLVSPSQSAGISQWERDLYTWADLRDPTMLVLPNEKLGFSKERGREPRPVPATLPLHRGGFQAYAEHRPDAIALPRQSEPLAATLARFWRPAAPPPPEPILIRPLDRGVFWRDPDGSLLPEAPAVSEEDVRGAIAAGVFPKYPTSIEVARLTQPAAPLRVKVARSCGNLALDSLAVEALRRAVGATALDEHYGRLQGALPGFYPAPGQNRVVEIEWWPGSEAEGGALP